MKKTSRLILTLLLVVMMVLGVVAPVVGYAANNSSVSQSNDSSSDSSYDAGWLRVERVGDELIVTLSPDIESLKQINTTVVKEIANEILGFAKDIVVDSLREDILNGQYGDAKEGFTDLDSVWATAFDSYMEQCGYQPQRLELFYDSRGWQDRCHDATVGRNRYGGGTCDPYGA